MYSFFKNSLQLRAMPLSLWARAIMRLSDMYVCALMFARNVITALLLSIGNRASSLRPASSLRAAICDRSDITDFVAVWYSATTCATISSLYNFIEKGVTAGYLAPSVLEKDIHLFYVRDGILHRSVINLSGEEKELSTNTDVDFIELQMIPGNPC